MWCAQAVIFLLMGIAFRAANREAVATRVSTHQELIQSREC
jgi:hypothetical protein